ncbi:SDR family oxidoreductase [Rhizobium sp. RU36D]|uniref:SDR family oxidoreductase n=1 Tax=Rhizobium sp. RU36D TaxID=1907415 RepID=UPI000A02ED89|nr:SDR family oxidoreductase [Rhizobium sp. RU36D]
MEKTVVKTALVTGAARRLGRAIAEDLARNGFKVAIHANKSVDQAEALAASLRAEGHEAVAIGADLRDAGATATLVERTKAALGPVGLLVNNASIFLEDDAARFDAERYQAHFDIHLRAPLILGAALRDQVAPGHQGLIVSIIDQRVWALTPRFFSYTLSKSALWTATRTMAQAFAPNVRVNAIGPGPTVRSERQSESDFQAQIDMLPMERGPQTEEFGRTIRFLFDTPSITGQMLALDGGQHLTWKIPGAAEIVE